MKITPEIMAKALSDAEAKFAKEWDEEAHPRGEGGRFGSGGGGGSSHSEDVTRSAATLARQTARDTASARDRATGMSRGPSSHEEANETHANLAETHRVQAKFLRQEGDDQSANLHDSAADAHQAAADAHQYAEQVRQTGDVQSYQAARGDAVEASDTAARASERVESLLYD
jgi:hypothetical protein